MLSNGKSKWNKNNSKQQTGRAIMVTIFGKEIVAKKGVNACYYEAAENRTNELIWYCGYAKISHFFSKWGAILGDNPVLHFKNGIVTDDSNRNAADILADIVHRICHRQKGNYLKNWDPELGSFVGCYIAGAVQFALKEYASSHFYTRPNNELPCETFEIDGYNTSIFPESLISRAKEDISEEEVASMAKKLAKLEEFALNTPTWEWKKIRIGGERIKVGRNQAIKIIDDLRQVYGITVNKDREVKIESFVGEQTEMFDTLNLPEIPCLVSKNMENIMFEKTHMLTIAGGYNSYRSKPANSTLNIFDSVSNNTASETNILTA